MNALMGLRVSSFPTGISFTQSTCLRGLRRGGRQDAKLRQQLSEVVVVSVLGDPPAGIELPNRRPPNAEGAAGRRHATYRAIIRPDHHPFVRVIGARRE